MIDDYASRRPEPEVLHLDSAAAGRQSEATLASTARHARAEAVRGAYVAQAESAEQVAQARADLGRLLGIPPDGVAFVEGATAGLRALLDAWPLPIGARIGVATTEWGPNLEMLEARGYRPVVLGTVLDPDAIHLDDLAAVHVTQVTSHRGLVQPVAAIAAACRGAGIPLWVDAAQAIGHVDTATGADAIYATSRKWLAGPRGVGVLAIPELHWDQLTVSKSPMSGTDLPPVSYLDSHDAHMAGRVGLASALGELMIDGPAEVFARLENVGMRVRAALAHLPGWSADDGTSAIVGVSPTAGQDVGAVCRWLLAEHRILTTPCYPPRAPLDMTAPLLRISAHVDVTDDAIERLCTALAASGSTMRDLI